MAQEQIPSRRLQLHSLLVSLLGSSNVYFQEPQNIKMQYPAIRYKWDDSETSYADNNPYRSVKRWQLTLMGWDPESEVIEKLEALPMCSFDRHYAVDNLNHHVFNLFF